MLMSLESSKSTEINYSYDDDIQDRIPASISGATGAMRSSKIVGIGALPLSATLKTATKGRKLSNASEASFSNDSDISKHSVSVSVPKSRSVHERSAKEGTILEEKSKEAKVFDFSRCDRLKEKPIAAPKFFPNSFPQTQQKTSENFSAKDEENLPHEKIGIRKGKWMPEEEAYTSRIIRDFNNGVIPLYPGTTLRTYLSDKLNCDPMRITKKFAGAACIGKKVFSPCEKTPENVSAMIASEKALAELEEKFWNRVNSLRPHRYKPRTISASPNVNRDSSSNLSVYSSRSNCKSSAKNLSPESIQHFETNKNETRIGRNSPSLPENCGNGLSSYFPIDNNAPYGSKYNRPLSRRPSHDEIVENGPFHCDNLNGHSNLVVSSSPSYGSSGLSSIQESVPSYNYQPIQRREGFDGYAKRHVNSVPPSQNICTSYFDENESSTNFDSCDKERKDAAVSYKRKDSFDRSVSDKDAGSLLLGFIKSVQQKSMEDQPSEQAVTAHPLLASKKGWRSTSMPALAIRDEDIESSNYVGMNPYRCSPSHVSRRVSNAHLDQITENSTGIYRSVKRQKSVESFLNDKTGNHK
mmetsp:Transcript_16550/g.23387  ORF Transcript_16550/g.23387 Transcript_16550/m.23387 type:complete len:582 (-) Transcript_16550:183-1928(-)